MNNRIKGAAVSYISTIVSIVVNLIYAPLLLHYLGKSEYGLYQIVASIFAYINIFETSISAGVLKFYCDAKAQNDPIKMENILAIARKIYRYFTLILAGATIALIAAFEAFYQSSFTQSELSESVYMLIALSINLAITMSNSIYLAAINANERFVFIKLLAILSQILNPLATLAVIIKMPWALSVVAVHVVINLSVAIIRHYYAKKKLSITVHLHYKDKTLAKAILVFASSILLASIADQIFWKADQIILGKLYSTSVVAVYAIGAQIYSVYMNLGTSISSVFFQKLSRMKEENNAIDKISDLFVRVGRVSFLILFLVLSGLIIFGRQFIYYWVGDGYSTAYYVAIVVMIPFTIDLIQNCGLSILQVLNKYSFRAKMYFVAAVLNIISTVVLAKYMGIVGAALSTGLTMFATSGVILNLYYAKAIHLDILSFWKNIGAILIKLIGVVVVGYLLNNIIVPTNNIMILIVKIFLYCIGYIVFAYYLVMDSSEKNIVRMFLNKVVRQNNNK